MSSQYQKRKRLDNSVGKANSLVLTSDLLSEASFWTVYQAAGHASPMGKEIRLSQWL